jgi:C4-dicarboxylate-specific signal transduction histidine kinase
MYLPVKTSSPVLTYYQRRRAQNRAAQRAYRQRKDQSLKQREQEVQSLKDELEKAQKLNKTLCKVVAVLRERLKEPAEEEQS